MYKVVVCFLVLFGGIMKPAGFTVTSGPDTVVWSPALGPAAVMRFSRRRFQLVSLQTRRDSNQLLLPSWARRDTGESEHKVELAALIALYWFG